MTVPPSVIDHDATIFVAGARGMVGSAIVRRLHAGGYHRVLAPPRAELDLQDQAAVHAYLAAHRPTYVFIAAAKVGGIQANNTYRVPISSTRTSISRTTWSTGRTWPACSG